MTPSVRPSAAESFERAGRVADTMLYEGYVLYPYRASSAKNQVRWQFGVLTPRRFAEIDGAEQWVQQTEVISEQKGRGAVAVRIRFLQVQARTVQAGDGGDFAAVAELAVDGQRLTSWEEAIEHAIDIAEVDLGETGETETSFALPAWREVQMVEGAGRVIRERWAIEGAVCLAVDDVPGPYPLRRLRVRVENRTGWDLPSTRREDGVRRSLVGVHVLLHGTDAVFLSSIDPPEFARGAVATCTNQNAFPVLIGPEGDDSTVLASPIILYDHPQVAAESPGDMCDATEIDEILALRVLTLTDEEKLEARALDPRAAAIVDRVDGFAPETFDRLHGVIRSLRPAPEEALPWWEPAVDAEFDPWTDVIAIGGIDVQKGSKVKLRPGKRTTDAQDLFLVGRLATVEGVFSDVDGEQHLAVTVDDDPAAELHQWHGRFLYFHPDEVEPLP